MILVTVGSTHFDELIEEIDHLVQIEIITDQVVFQIGNGEYIPKFGSHYRFNKNIAENFKSADLIITHGGLTTLQILKMGQDFIAISNTNLQDDHQTLFLTQLSKYTPIRWSNSPKDVEKLLKQAVSTEINQASKPDIAQKIYQYNNFNT